MAIGLTLVFYVVHVRYWVVPVQDGRGNLALWIGGSANRNRDAFEQTFKRLVEQIEKQLKPNFAEAAEQLSASLPKTTTAGR
jgi:hypothetical protein